MVGRRVAGISDPNGVDLCAKVLEHKRPIIAPFWNNAVKTEPFKYTCMQVSGFAEGETKAGYEPGLRGIERLTGCNDSPVFSLWLLLPDSGEVLAVSFVPEVHALGMFDSARRLPERMSVQKMQNALGYLLRRALCASLSWICLRLRGSCTPYQSFSSTCALPIVTRSMKTTSTTYTFA